MPSPFLLYGSRFSIPDSRYQPPIPCGLITPV